MGQRSKERSRDVLDDFGRGSVGGAAIEEELSGESTGERDEDSERSSDLGKVGESISTGRCDHDVGLIPNRGHKVARSAEHHDHDGGLDGDVSRVDEGDGDGEDEIDGGSVGEEGGEEDGREVEAVEGAKLSSLLEKVDKKIADGGGDSSVLQGRTEDEGGGHLKQNVALCLIRVSEIESKGWKENERE